MLTEANRFRMMYMRPDAIHELVKRCPIALQPSGLLEWHGQQNAVGLDGLLAQYMCERAILKINDGGLFPVNWVGTYGYIRYPGTVCYDQETTISVFYQLFREMMKIGFKVILILLGHWGEWQQNALKAGLEKANLFAKQNGLKVKLFGLRWADFLFGVNTGGHGKEGETSALWRMSDHYGLKLVDLTNFKQGEQRVPRYTLVDPTVPVREPDPWTWENDLKDRTRCSPEIGEYIVSTISEGIAEEMKDTLEELGLNPP